MIRPVSYGVAGVVLFALAGFFSFMIDKELNSSRAAFNFQDALFRFVGSAKEMVGDTLFLKADSYYHGGAEMHYEETPEELEREGDVEHTEEGEARAKAAEKDWIAGVNHQIRSYEHYHLVKADQKEMLPFFALATSLNPHNVEAILTTAYWLDSHLGKTDAAIETLLKGGKNNPDAWEIEDSLAKIYFSRLKNYAASEKHFLDAIQKAERKAADDHTLANLYFYLAESRRPQGKKEEALRAYRSALDHLKETDPLSFRKTVDDKIRELSS